MSPHRLCARRLFRPACSLSHSASASTKVFAVEALARLLHLAAATPPALLAPLLGAPPSTASTTAAATATGATPSSSPLSTPPLLPGGPPPALMRLVPRINDIVAVGFSALGDPADRLRCAALHLLASAAQVGEGTEEQRYNGGTERDAQHSRMQSNDDLDAETQRAVALGAAGSPPLAGEFLLFHMLRVPPLSPTIPSSFAPQVFAACPDPDYADHFLVEHVEVALTSALRAVLSPQAPALTATPALPPPPTLPPHGAAAASATHPSSATAVSEGPGHASPHARGLGALLAAAFMAAGVFSSDESAERALGLVFAAIGLPASGSTDSHPSGNGVQAPIPSRELGAADAPGKQSSASRQMMTLVDSLAGRWADVKTSDGWARLGRK